MDRTEILKEREIGKQQLIVIQIHRPNIQIQSQPLPHDLPSGTEGSKKDTDKRQQCDCRDYGEYQHHHKC